MCAKCKIAIGKPCSNVSPDLFGLFLEDINWACEGGLNANLVMNYSFEDTYIDQKTTEISLTSAKKPAAIQVDRLRYWHGTGCTLESRKSDGISENSWYARITASPDGTLSNLGYNGGKKHAGKCAMWFAPGQTYR